MPKIKQKALFAKLNGSVKTERGSLTFQRRKPGGEVVIRDSWPTGYQDLVVSESYWLELRSKQP